MTLSRRERSLFRGTLGAVQARAMVQASEKKPSPDERRQLKVFLCHSSKDKPAVRKLHELLGGAGCQPWLDEKDIPGGAHWHDAIDKAVRTTDVVLVCLSAHSVNAEGSLLGLGCTAQRGRDIISVMAWPYGPLWKARSRYVRWVGHRAGSYGQRRGRW